MKFLNDIGKYKALMDRELQYVSRLQFVMIAYLFIKDVGVHWWYLLLIPAVILWTWFDIKYILPSELDYLHGKSPVFQKLLKK